MRYDTPTADLLATCAAALPEPFSRADVLAWFAEHHPDVRPVTVAGLLSHVPQGPSDGPVERLSRGRYRRARGVLPDVVLVTTDGTGTTAAPPAGPGRPATFRLSPRWGLIEPDEPSPAGTGACDDGSARAWAAFVVARLSAHVTLLAAVVELRAEPQVVELLRPVLHDAGAAVTLEPSTGVTGDAATAQDRPAGTEVPVEPGPTGPVDTLLARLGDLEAAISLSALARETDLLASTAMYAWWVDGQGAAELSDGLGQPVAPGVVYAGLAHAQQPPEPRRGAAALLAKVTVLRRPRSQPSQFRLSLGAVLAAAAGGPVDDATVTTWMHEHLRVVAVPLGGSADADALERAVLARLDPPLNATAGSTGAVHQALLRLRAQPVG